MRHYRIINLETHKPYYIARVKDTQVRIARKLGLSTSSKWAIFEALGLLQPINTREVA